MKSVATHYKGRSAGLLATIIPAALFLSAPSFAQSVIYCCTDANARKVCGDFLPKECQKRAYEERDGKGYIIKQVDAPMNAEQLARRDAELAKKAELAQKELEDRRRNQALLSTYTSEQDIDKARDRALADLDKSIVQVEKALAESIKRQQTLDKEKEFYAGKPLPAQVKQQLADAEKDIKAKTDAVAARKQDKEKVKTSFEDEKSRFRDLKDSGGKVGVPADEKAKREVIVQPPPPLTPPMPAAAEKTNGKPADAAAPKKN